VLFHDIPLEKCDLFFEPFLKIILFLSEFQFSRLSYQRAMECWDSYTSFFSWLQFLHHVCLMASDKREVKKHVLVGRKNRNEKDI